MKVTLIGMGPGGCDGLGSTALSALAQASVLIGSSRLMESIPPQLGQERFTETRSTAILDCLKRCGEENACVLFSGDTGFYSGASGLVPLLEDAGIEAQLLPGISSVQLLSARIRRPWQDWKLVSGHGRTVDVIAAVMEGRPTFFLVGGALTAQAICSELSQGGLGSVQVTVGERLGISGERIVRGPARALQQQRFDALSVVLVDAVPVSPRRACGWPDDEFIRDAVPMTKQPVRATALGLLRVAPSDICWDVGAGTGSVSVELAAVSARTYAVECKPDAQRLIRRNREKARAWNLTVVDGHAPEVLVGLPDPDVVFIGGSGGSLGAIFQELDQRPRWPRLCVSALTLETLQESLELFVKRDREPQVCQVGASHSKSVGSSHLLMASNSVFLVTEASR